MTRHRFGVDMHTIEHWIRGGYLHLPNPGSGIRRRYPPGEVRAIRALDAIRRLAGCEPREEQSVSHGHRARRTLRLLIAKAARENPAGTVVEINSPVPWIRHVLIVPPED